MRRLVYVVMMAFMMILSATSLALAHHFEVTTGLSLGDVFEVEHEEATPYGGWVTINVTNTGTVAWGDFHFSFFPVSGYDISNLHWIDAGSSQSITYSIDNDTDTATLDLYFYGDPLLPGENGFFSGYSDNQDGLSWFGVAAYPTPVPIPAAVWLLGSGLLGMAGLRSRLVRRGNRS